MLIFFIFLLSIFSTIFLLKWQFTTPTPPKNHPPSPPTLPIIGNLHQLGPFPHRSLYYLSQIHGPVMLLHFGNVPVLVVSSAVAAHDVMKTHDLVFSDRPKCTIQSKLVYDSKDVAFSPYGEYWRQMRSIAVLHLLSTRRVSSFHTVRDEETALLIGSLERSFASSPSSVVNLSELFALLTNNVVCRMVLGRKYDGGEWKGRKFKEVLGHFVELLGVFDVGDYVPWLRWVNHVNGVYQKVKKVTEELDEFLETVVEEHVRRGEDHEVGCERVDDGGSRHDFVDVLLEVQGKNLDDLNFHRDSIKAIILDMFAAGTDTTYTALEWAMTELLRHPRVMEQLQKEIRERSKSHQPIVTEDDLDQMKYLKAVIKETLRLHPPIPLLVPRMSTSDVKVLGFDITAGTHVITNAWAIGRDPSSWDEPEEFRPERFFETAIDFRGHDFQLIPFGAGRRGCPGIQFSMTINELALANLVQKFDFALPGGARGEELDMAEVAGLTIHKKSPLLVVVTPWFSE